MNSVIFYTILTCLVSFTATLLCMRFLPFGKKLLGHDRGRLYAEGSEVNIGKPTGVGIYFVTVFVLTSFIMGYTGAGFLICMFLVILSMVFGFLDDRSEKPWGEYIKGALDFFVAVAGALVFTTFYGTEVHFCLTGSTVVLPEGLYFVLAVILIVVSINATNATDGVDGLSGTLTILTLLSFIALAAISGTVNMYNVSAALTMISVLAAYLIFNFFPSKVLMGDAGSRALGFFIAFYAMYVKLPFAYIIICLPFLLDGGLSILKITIGRLTKKKIIILKNLVTPVHDHLKKRKGLSVPKTWAVIVSTALVIDILYIGICFILNR